MEGRSTSYLTGRLYKHNASAARARARPLEVGRRRRRRRRPLFCRIAKKMPPAVIGDQTHSESVEKGGARLPHDIVWPWPGWASRGRKEKKMNVNMK